MEAAFNDWADQYIGTCDFSFAIPKFSKRTSQHCAKEETSDYMVDDDTFNLSLEYDEDSLTSTSSCRSVTFSESVECHTVARYIDQENRRDLFYSGADVARFKQEFKIEKMQLSKSYWLERSVSLNGLKKAILGNRAVTSMQSTSSDGDSATLCRPPTQINVNGMFV